MKIEVKIVYETYREKKKKKRKVRVGDRKISQQSTQTKHKTVRNRKHLGLQRVISLYVIDRREETEI